MRISSSWIPDLLETVEADAFFRDMTTRTNKRHGAAWWLLVLVIWGGVACKKKEAGLGSEPVASSSAMASASPSPQEQAREKIRLQREIFSKEQAPPLRRASYEKLREVIDSAAGVLPEGELKVHRSARADEILMEEEKIKKELESMPEKPVYDGAFQLGGAVRTCYKDGVVLESNGKFYFVKDATCPDTPLLRGWVEDTGETVPLDIGRTGRDAKVVEISDKEKAQDDRKAFNERMAAYSTALAANPNLPKERDAKVARLKALDEEFDAALLALVGSAPPAAPSGSR